MKNIIILLSLIFSANALSFEAISLTELTRPAPYSMILKTNFCKTIACLSFETPTLEEKTTTRAVDLMYKHSQAHVENRLESMDMKVESVDFTYSPSEYEIIDLLSLDFTSADGDGPLSESEIASIMRKINTRNAEVSIMGVVSHNGISEYLVIYTPSYDKIFIVERNQFTKRAE
jgi:hypothetical protein